MSASPVDALLPIAPLARAAEAPSRGDREGSAFGPALEQAYAAENARESAAPAEADDELAETAVDESSDSFSTADEQAEAGPEASEEASHVVEAGQTSEMDEESTADEVEISALARTVVAVNEAQVAAIAGECDQTGDEPAGDAVSAARKSGEDQPKAPRKLNESLPGAGAEAAAKGEAIKNGKRGRETAESSSAAASDKSTAGVQEIETQEIDASQPLVEKAGAIGEGASDETDQRQSRTTKTESAEPVKLPPVGQTAELAAAIERHGALIDPSSAAEGGGAEAAATQPVDATTGGTSTQRAAAALDRLAETSLRRNDDAAQADGGPQIDRPRFVQRVEGALRAAQQRDGRVQVRLAPPELGVVHIELAVQNGVMTAKLEAETAAARNALLDNLPALRERLAEQNIRVEKFDVDVRRDSQGGGNNNGTHDGSGDHGESNSHGRRGRPATTPSTVLAAPKSTSAVKSASDAGLDVRI